MSFLNNTIKLIPPYDFHHIWVMPWQDGFSSYAWVMLMGFLVSASCGLVGCFLVLRRMALMGDAMSHSVLPGIVIAFLISRSRGILPMSMGALVAGLLTAFVIELVHRNSRLKTDAALAVVFSSAFALGVLMLSLWADTVDLDLDCVLFGEMAFIPFAESTAVFGLNVPLPILRMAGIGFSLIGLIAIFYKELLISSFDLALARSMGIPIRGLHYILMAALSFVLVGAFEAVGAILVIAMLILPIATARFWSNSLPKLLVATIFLSMAYSILGLHLAIFLDASIAGSMASLAFFLFLLSWLSHYFVRQWQRKSFIRDSENSLSQTTSS